MTLSEIRDSEILHVLHETYELWSAGLSREDYCDYNQFQRNHQWGRSHLKFLALRHNGEIAAGCKTYSINAVSRGRDYAFIGVGALFSRRKYRGQGFGSEFMEQFIARALDIEAKGIVLFSDIGADFYERFGFQELSSVDFSINTSEAGWQSGAEPLLDYEIEPLAFEHADYLARYHRRWLSKRPFGIERDDDYWHYKIAKENFLHEHSRLSWPRLQLLKISEKGNQYANGGYCIYEIGGATLRILEIIDGGCGADNLWRALLSHAARLQIRRIKGWEGNLREFKPGFNLKSFLAQDVFKDDYRGQIHYSERNWGRAMMLPLDPDVEEWFQHFPCPLMELDHL